MMATCNVERSDSQRSQSNGPRVSFNRDVHVKRIGLRGHEQPNYPTSHGQYSQPASQLRRELPNDLSKEAILKEAALVLLQAEKVKCFVDAGNGETKSSGSRSNVKIRIPGERKIKSDDNAQWFHSLPLRKKKRILVNRSSSDASTKKNKKPSSIFSIFSRKSDSNLDQVDSNIQPVKKLIRTKSDVEEFKQLKVVRRTDVSEDDDRKYKGQLSPIIENLNQEKNFEKSIQLKGSKLRKGFKSPEKYLVSTNTTKNTPPSGNIGFTNVKDLDFVPSKPISDLSITNSNPTLPSSLEQVNSTSTSDIKKQRSNKQLLTKSLIVDGMIRRLSMDRFSSPPPQIHAPAFSYIRPNDYVVYAGVAYDNEAKSKQTVHERYTKSSSSPVHETNATNSRSPPLQMNQSNTSSSDMVNQANIILYKNIQNHERSLSPVQHLRPIRNTFKQSSSPVINLYQSPEPLSTPRAAPRLQKSFLGQSDSINNNKHRENSDEDEGVGLDTRPDIDEVVITSQTLQNQTTFSELNDQKRFEIDDLSTRRQQLESRMVVRRMGSLERLLEQDNANNDIFSSKEKTDHMYYQEYPVRTEFNIQNYYNPVKQHRHQMSNSYDGIPIFTEFQIKNRLHSPRACREIDLGYIENNYHQNVSHIEPDTSYFEEKYQLELKPKSLENESGPLSPQSRTMNKYHQLHHIPLTPDHYLRYNSQDNNHYPYAVSSLMRNKNKNRFSDKGDSGIENDCRKDAYADDHHLRCKYQTLDADIEDTELFLKRERQHTEMLHLTRYNYIFRERSIDDGSHFDPRLDKYQHNKINRRDNRINGGELHRRTEQKIGGLEKVKQLFALNTLKKKSVSSSKKGTSAKDLEHAFIHKENESKSCEHIEAIDVPEMRLTDIALRRRLSTPKASPLPKRTPSLKSSKSSNVSVQTDKQSKSSWFKSLDRLSRKKFESSSKSNDVQSTMKSLSRHVITSANETASNKLEQNLRFFGDTDIESNVQHVDKPASRSKDLLQNSILEKNQKHYQNLNALNTANQRKEILSNDRNRSASLQNLDKQNKYRQRNLSLEQHDTSGATIQSDKSLLHCRDKYDNINDIGKTHKQFTPAEKFDSQCSREVYKDQRRERGRPRERSPWALPNYRYYDRAISESRKPPTGSQTPTRHPSRRNTSASRDRDRVHDSSGTEGDSSQQSQHSVVYLHATTVGSIPQPYVIKSRRTMSRDDLLSRSTKKKLEPMTRTVSRSFSVLAPWKPKHPNEEYEIHYLPAHESNLLRKDRSTSLTRNPRKYSTKDEFYSIQKASLTNTNSTPMLPYRSKERDPRKPILLRKR